MVGYRKVLIVLSALAAVCIKPEVSEQIIALAALGVGANLYKAAKANATTTTYEDQ